MATLDHDVVAGLVALGDEGGENILKLLVDIFSGEEAPACLARIEQAMHAGDAVEVAEGAHKLKGSAAQLGATRLRELCASLETDARSGDLSTDASLFADISAEVDVVNAALKLAIPSPTAGAQRRRRVARERARLRVSSTP
jgi:HPt (histidine-containing phosphotransfer) domain-containing protein